MWRYRFDDAYFLEAEAEGGATGPRGTPKPSVPAGSGGGSGAAVELLTTVMPPAEKGDESAVVVAAPLGCAHGDRGCNGSRDEGNARTDAFSERGIDRLGGDCEIGVIAADGVGVPRGGDCGAVAGVDKGRNSGACEGRAVGDELGGVAAASEARTPTGWTCSKRPRRQDASGVLL